MAPRQGWARAHLPKILQVLVFIGAAIVLFGAAQQRPDRALSVLALALSGVAGGGPLLGVEDDPSARPMC